MDRPRAEELDAETARRLEAVADTARAEIDRHLAQRPGVAGGLDQAADALDALRDAYVAAGLDRVRASRATTVVMFERLDAVASLAHADALLGRDTDAAPGVLGQR